MKPIRDTLQRFVREEILPRYDAFDPGHRRDHAEAVIAQALELAEHYGVDPEILYVAAAYHDLGIAEGRETHHLVSGRIIRADQRLLKWLSPEAVELAAQAAEDHRASSDRAPRTLYGRIIAEADRLIDPETVIRRTVEYGFSHYPELDWEGHWHRTLDHLHEKYAEGGYLKLWIPESRNAGQLAKLRALIADETALRSRFEKYYDLCHTSSETNRSGKKGR